MRDHPTPDLQISVPHGLLWRDGPSLSHPIGADWRARRSQKEGRDEKADWCSLHPRIPPGR